MMNRESFLLYQDTGTTFFLLIAPLLDNSLLFAPLLCSHQDGVPVCGKNEKVPLFHVTDFIPESYKGGGYFKSTTSQRLCGSVTSTRPDLSGTKGRPIRYQKAMLSK